jgi:hypothetical protein
MFEPQASNVVLLIVSADDGRNLVASHVHFGDLAKIESHRRQSRHSERIFHGFSLLRA